MTFQYSPLDESKDEFRLLTLHHGEAETPIRCTLKNVPLGEFSFHDEGIYRWSGCGFGWERPRPDSDESKEWEPLMWHNVGDGLGLASESVELVDQPRFFGKEPDMTGLSLVPVYEALSYTWGDPTVTTSIEVNGVEFPVTTNLFAALKRLRKLVKDRILWVDAVCIDQGNLDERAKQVRRMRSIYQRAQQVLVWLGDAGNNSERAITLLEKLGGRYKEVSTCIEFQDYGEWYGPQFRSFPHMMGEKANEIMREQKTKALRRFNLGSPQDFDEADWAAMEDFLTKRVYWTRMWVVQETAYARSIKLYCGPNSMGFDTFNHITYNEKMVQDLTPPGRHLVARFANFINHGGVGMLLGQHEQAREWTRVYGFEKEGTSLLHLLSRFRSYKSTDPRDKVYALLGLPSISDDMSFHKPDYSLPVSTIFCETARAIIRYEKSLHILCLGHSNSEKRQHDLPSWVPDWSSLPEATPLIDITKTKQAYQASEKSTVEGPDVDPASGDEAEGQRRREQAGDSMFLRGTAYFGKKNGLADRQLEYTIPPARVHDKTLVINGVSFDTICETFPPVPESALESGEWRDIVFGWQKKVAPDDLGTGRGDPSRVRPLIELLCTILKEQSSSPPEMEGVSWPDVLFEKYLVWSGLFEEDEFERPELHSKLASIDDLIKKELLGWKIAMTNKGIMSMVPTRSEAGDLITVMLGADVPFVLRSTKDPHDQFEMIGTAYVGGVMHGEVMKLLDEGKVEKRTFTLV